MNTSYEIKQLALKKGFQFNHFVPQNEIECTNIDNEELLAWIFNHEYFYFESYINNYKNIEKTHWLEFWYINLKRNNFTLIGEFEYRLENWFEKNNYLFEYDWKEIDYNTHKIGHRYSISNSNFESDNSDHYSYVRYLGNTEYLENKQQAKEEIILKLFNILKSK